MFDYRKGWMKSDCPFCGGVLKFGVNLSRNRTNCFRCTYHKNPIYTVMEIEGIINYADAYIYIKAFEEAEYLETPVSLLEEKPAKLPESFKLLNFGSSRIGDMARNYMSHRGFDIDELSLKGIGYCTKGDFAFRIIFPFHERGLLRYFNARQFMEIGVKFKNPPIEEFGVGKNLLIYNVDVLNIYDKIEILESITNCLTLGDNATSIGGKIMSHYQMSKYMSSPVKKLVIILDPDAYHRALKTGLQFVYHKKIKVVKLPDEVDVNDLGKKETKKYIKATPYMNYKELYKLYINTPLDDH